MEHSAKKVKLNSEALPSSEEQRQLQQLEILMRNNLLQLQTSELLQQTDATKKLTSKKILRCVEILLEDAKNTSTKTCHGREITHQWLLTQNYVGLELVDSINQSNSQEQMPDTKIVYQAPTKIDLIGSNTYQTGVVPFYNIDIAVTIPAGIIESKDILNHSYFDKRKLYLAGLRKSLEVQQKKHGDRYKNFSTALLKGDVRKPILQLQPFNSDSVTIRIIPVLDASSVKLVQLKSSKNNVRPKAWMAKVELNREQKKEASDLDMSLLSPTPMYNNAILEDICLLLHHQIIEKAIKPFDNIQRTVALFKIWLRQRELTFVSGGFDSHLATLLIAYLVQTKRLQPSISPEISFQTLLSFIQNFDSEKTALDFTTSSLLAKKQLPDDQLSFLQLWHPLSLGQSSDKSFSYNAFWRLTESASRMLKTAAQQSLSDLSQTQKVGAFDRLFLQPCGFIDSHDEVLHLDIDSWDEILNSEHLSAEDAEILEKWSLHWPVELFVSTKVFHLVTKALGDRVKAVHVLIESSASASITPSFTTIAAAGSPKYKLTIGLTLDREKSHRRVERGPTAAALGEGSGASDSALEAFREFWGDKVQVRRFKDGSIVESVVWEASTASLFDDIINYILGRHMPYIFDSLTSAVQGRLSAVQPDGLISSGEKKNSRSLYLKSIEAFDELRGILVSKLTNLPLSFDSVMALTGELRYTSLYPPSPHIFDSIRQAIKASGGEGFEYKDLLQDVLGQNLSLLVNPIPVLAKFESSGKWPTEAEAIEKCKTAFLLRTRAELAKQFQIMSIIHPLHLDVLYKGFVFRLLPFANSETEKIVALHDINNGEASALPILTEIPHTVFQINHRYMIPALHHNAVKALVSQFPIYSDAVRLLRLWAARRYLSGHLCQEAIELIVAQEFLLPRTLLPPATAGAAFYKALRTIAEYNWDDEPFIVDLSGDLREMTAEVRTSIATKFRASKTATEDISDAYVSNAIHPPMYIVSSSDKLNEYEPWLRGKSPEKVVLGMLVNAARSSLKKIKDWLEARNSSDSSSGREADDDDLHHNAFLEVFNRNDAVISKCNSVLYFNKALICERVSEGPQFAQTTIFSNLSKDDLDVSRLSIIGSDYSANPVQGNSVVTLRDLLGPQALFFWDETGGEQLGVLWRPRFFKTKAFSILDSRFCTPTMENSVDESSGKESERAVLTPNYPEVLHHILAACPGLVYQR